jgi:tetratricopeptide (TPR) repeat protein
MWPWVLAAALPLISQPPEGCLAAAAVSALVAEGVSAPSAAGLMREVPVFTDGVEPADLAKALARRGVTLLRFTPRAGELAQATARVPLLAMLEPGHVVAVFQGRAMDPAAPRSFVPQPGALDAARVAFFVGDAPALTRAADAKLDVPRWKSEDGHYRAGVYALRASFPGADAVALLEEAAAADPSDAAVQNDLGVAYARAGHYGHALAAFDRALMLAPRLQEARRNRERVLKLARARP